MEPSYKTRKITGRLLLCFILLAGGWAALAQYSSRLVQALSRPQSPVPQITLGTAPAMTVTYDPVSLKAHITVQAHKCNAKKQNCLPGKTAKFFIPKQANRELFWEDFKHTLVSWRYNPLLVGRTVWSYLTAWHEKRTNLSPAEFLLLCMELTRLEPSDFTVKIPPAAQKRTPRRETATPAGPVVQDRAPLAVKDRPLIIEILNASGKRGLAQELTQYLRAQNEKGLLRVDVFQYDNYPTLQESSWVEEYTGRLAETKQLGHALGIYGEIRTGTAPNVMCDTRLILGKDFTVPL